MGNDGFCEKLVRFMRYANPTSTPGECWLWSGHSRDGRYGHFTVDAETVHAHRWIYELVHGPIPAGLLIRHKCDTPRCVNPMHLEVGTHRDNARDMVSRGRNPNRQGVKHPLARLKDADIVAIRTLASCGHRHQDIASMYGISRQQVGKITRRENWRHL